jgi:secreted trypsin-like serine protease
MKILVLFVLFVAVTCYSQEEVLNAEVSEVQDIQPSIKGGSIASLGQFPYQAAVFFKLEGKEFICSGALIKHKWVLTVRKFFKIHDHI